MHPWTKYLEAAYIDERLNAQIKDQTRGQQRTRQKKTKDERRQDQGNDPQTNSKIKSNEQIPKAAQRPPKGERRKNE